ncbi:HNH endonuclease [Egbenema bharatensis]|uniref:HNH endonuclease n=1 Tax=Egbenema bharatensis TaxID=3463334 RepID=UPI003A8B8B9A
MQKDLNYYINRFTNLNVNTVGGKAPYQPLLLLSVIELIEQRLIQENKIYLSLELISTFAKFRSQLSTPYYQADLAQPFFFLSRAKNPFWYLQPKPGFENVLESGVKLNRLSLLRKNIDYAELDDELFDLLKSPINRAALIVAIASKCFSEKIEQVQSLFQIHSFQDIRYSLRESGATYSTNEMSEKEVKEFEDIVRDATFRRNVVSLYGQRCAFCKLRIISRDSGDIVDGAHIKPFSRFKDDSYTNGLALCKNHHWAFDHGWFSIDDDYRIIIPADRFIEEPPEESKRMQEFNREQIHLPDQSDFHPRSEALAWHRDHWHIA